MQDSKSLPESFYTPFLSDIAKARLPSPSTRQHGSNAERLTRWQFGVFFHSRLLLGFSPCSQASQTRRRSRLLPLASLPNPTENGHAASEDINLSLSGPELAAGLQYGPTGGMAPLVDWLYDLQRTVHGRERGEGWGLSVGSGSQDLLSKVGVADFEGPPPNVDRPSLRC